MKEITLGDAAKLVREAAAQQGVDPELAFAILVAENSKAGEFNPGRKLSIDTTSPKGAKGIMQVRPTTFKALQEQGYIPETARLDNIKDQIFAGVAAIREKQKVIKSTDPVLTAIAYNAGPKAVTHYQMTGVLPNETAGYVPKVQRNLAVNNELPAAPGMPAAPGGSALSAATDAFNTQRSQLPLLQQLMEAIVNEGAAAGEKAKSAIGALGEAASATFDAKAAIDTNSAKYLNKIANAFGATTEDPESRLMKANEQQAIAAQMLAKMQPEVQALQSVDITQDPIGYIMAQFKLAGVAGKWNAAAMAKDTAAAEIAEIQQQTARQQAIQPAILEEDRIRLAQAQSRAARAEAEMKALGIDDATRRQRLGMLEVRERMAGTLFTSAMQMARLEQDQQQFAERKTAAGRETKVVTLYNDYLRRFGMAADFSSLPEFKTLGARAEAFVAENASASTVALAGSPGKAAEGIMLFRSTMPKLRQERPIAAQEINGVMELAHERVIKEGPARMMDAGWKKADDAAKIGIVVDEIFKEARNDLTKKNHEELPEGHAYKLNHEIAASSPELEKNRVAKFVRDQKATTGVLPGTREVVDNVLARIKAGDKGAETELLEYFQKGYAYSSYARGYDLLSVDLTDPKSKSGTAQYRVNPAQLMRRNWTEGLFGESYADVDVLNPAGLNKLLSILNARRAVEAAAGPAGTQSVFRGTTATGTPSFGVGNN